MSTLILDLINKSNPSDLTYLQSATTRVIRLLAIILAQVIQGVTVRYAVRVSFDLS